MQEWLSANTLFASLIWGSVGAGYFFYGKKQNALAPVLGGIAMVAVSLLVSNWLWMSLLCVGVMAGVWLHLRQNG